MYETATAIRKAIIEANKHARDRGVPDFGAVSPGTFDALTRDLAAIGFTPWSAKQFGDLTRPKAERAVFMDGYWFVPDDAVKEPNAVVWHVSL